MKFAKRDEVYQVVWEFVAGMGKHLCLVLTIFQIHSGPRTCSGSFVLLNHINRFLSLFLREMLTPK